MTALRSPLRPALRSALQLLSLRPTASLDLTFVGVSSLDSRITFTRASTGSYFDSAGTLQSAGNNVARLDYNPSTLAAQGLLIEESRTNSIRNNTMVGAAPGTPGTLPTNWQVVNTAGLSTSVIGVGVEAGVSYVDVRVFGTTTNTTFTLSPELGGTISATTGQAWAASNYIKTVAGSTANISTIELGWSEQNSTPAFLSFNMVVISVATTGSLAANRRSYAATNLQATTAFIRPALNLGLTSIGVAIDITLRIGLPQLEQGAFATSVIPTTAAAATRSADVASVNTLTPWYNATAGTLYLEATPNTPTTNAANQGGVSLDDATLNNRIQLFRASSTGSYGVLVSNAGVTGYNTANSVWANQTTGKTAIAFAALDQKYAYAGALDVGSGTGAVPSVTRLTLGARADGVLQFNGYLRRVTFYPRRLGNTELQAITA